VVSRAVASTRVLEYYSSSKPTRVIFYYSSTRYILFLVANFRLQFLQSIDELLEFMKTWDFAISFVYLSAWK